MAAILGDPEALAAEVSRRAHHKAVEIAEDARRRAAAVLEGAAQEGESARKESVEAADREVTALNRKNAARAELEAKRRFILLREAPMTRLWLACEQRLRDLVHEAGYRDVLKGFALRAAQELGGSELNLTSDPVGHELLSQETLEEWSRQAGIRFTRAPQPGEFWGGLLVTAGRDRFDATFPSRLSLAETTLRERVYGLLRGSPAGAEP